MEQEIETAVRRAVVTMRENLGERLTVDDLARSAMFSKFHFTRIFGRVTGVSPGRFLSAVRLQHAQRLLVSTKLNVADISMLVGYNSVGTFSSRFSRSVGMSPTSYRQHSGFATRIEAGTEREQAATGARVHCRVAPPADGRPSLVFAGLFPERIPEGRPVRCAVVTAPAAFSLNGVPSGTWHLLAQSVPGTRHDPDGYQANVNESVQVASHGPITVRRHSEARVDLDLKHVGALDPPVLLAMLDARKLAMSMVAERDAA
jgi:AraC family transcriptional regulator